MPKFDMHCHTKEGSIDAKIPIEEYIQILKSKGFDGMLVTDHDSYKGYRYWKEKLPYDSAFTVLKGVEYDTRDAGHYLVIMPDGIDLPMLQVRGMKLNTLIHLVHQYGGILGPAHPFGARSSSVMFCKRLRKEPSHLKNCDFIEGFNTCETHIANLAAQNFAKKMDLVCIGGSDSHKSDYVGMGYTNFLRNIRCNNDIISAIKAGDILDFGGIERTFLQKHKKRNSVFATYGFKAYNRTLGFIFKPYRKLLVRNFMSV